ncbi:MAG: ABC transporter ATP-binding protein, partial [Burkholderiales bacterium]
TPSLARSAPAASQAVPAAEGAAESAPDAAGGRGRARQRPDKLSYRETRELAEIPARIAALEAEQRTTTARLQDPQLYAEAPEQARQLAERLSEIDAGLTALLERWEWLEQRLDANRPSS